MNWFDFFSKVGSCYIHGDYAECYDASGDGPMFFRLSDLQDEIENQDEEDADAACAEYDEFCARAISPLSSSIEVSQKDEDSFGICVVNGRKFAFKEDKNSEHFGIVIPMYDDTFAAVRFFEDDVCKGSNLVPVEKLNSVSYKTDSFSPYLGKMGEKVILPDSL